MDRLIIKKRVKIIKKLTTKRLWGDIQSTVQGVDETGSIAKVVKSIHHRNVKYIALLTEIAMNFHQVVLSFLTGTNTNEITYSYYILCRNNGRERGSSVRQNLVVLY